LTSVPATPSRWPAPSTDRVPGAGLAILVNANAKRGGRRVAVQIGRALPAASVRLTKAAREIDAWLLSLPTPRGVFAAGGDGTAVALLNAVARTTPAGQELPTIGILPLGTGNGWAHALGAPKLHRCLERLARSPGPLPARRCTLVEVEGTLTHFAGSGWDAMILEDYKRQLAASTGPGRRLSKSVYGYLSAAILRTAPRVIVSGNPHLVIENLGPHIYALDASGAPKVLEGAGPGTIVFDGPAGIASVATCTTFGYNFRAFPFAERMPGYMSVRAYARPALGALLSVPQLWRGAHPLEGMHDWLATHVRMTFSRPLPLQIGGDAHGMRQSVEYRASKRGVGLVDWRAMI
jgi:diacylglycerol kinase family enzyme